MAAICPRNFPTGKSSLTAGKHWKILLSIVIECQLRLKNNSCSHADTSNNAYSVTTYCLIPLASILSFCSAFWHDLFTQSQPTMWPVEFIVFGKTKLLLGLIPSAPLTLTLTKHSLLSSDRLGLCLGQVLQFWNHGHMLF